MTKRGRWLAASAVGLLLLAVLAVLSAPGIPARASSPTFYTDRTTFEAALGTKITDGYDSPPYPAGWGCYSDTVFSAFFGETDYQATGFTDHNFHLERGAYCAGCNGSFRLSFVTTTVSLADTGVYGVGLDILENDDEEPYWAFITYGDGSTDDIPLPVVVQPGSSFFGVIAPELIVSIHFGLEKGGSTEDGSFIMDNLTIGRQYTFYLPLSLYRVGG